MKETSANKAYRQIQNHHIHLEKKGIRVFGVAESFSQFNTKSILAGIVMRRDLIIDGLIFGNSTLKGDDSTENIISMYKALKRNDINCIMLNGLIISMYNIVDGQKICDKIGLPIIAITFKDSKGVEDNIRDLFTYDRNLKLEQYKKLGKRKQILLDTGKSIFIRHWGLTLNDSITILNSFTLQGSVPEPLRVAKLAARANIQGVINKVY